MNTQGIRRVGLVMIVLFIGLAAQLTYLQVVHADKLANDPRNARGFLRNVERARGPIVTADGVIVAESVKSGDEFKYQRVYPPATAQLFAQVVGYQSLQYGESGVERAYSDQLAGRDFSLQTKSLADLFANRQPVGTVVMTLSDKIQQVAASALNGQRGSVVVLDVHTGGVVAAYSNPTYDPNPLASHNSKLAGNARKLYLAAPGNPLLPKPWAELYPPGSTFKTVTASIALQNNVDVDKQFPVVREIPLPQTNGQTLANFGHELCGGSLLQSFIVSCNTTFGQVGFDLGDTFAADLPNFGVATTPPPSGGASGIDPAIAPSTGPAPGTFQQNQPAFMQDAIGQNQIAVPPLEMAMVAEAVATGGTILQPHFVQCVKDPDDRVVSTVNPAQYKQAMNPATANQMKDFMLGVVNDPNGTGTAAQIPGVQVAGKTGTAETAAGEKPHAWFIEFAPAEAPRYAIAVLVEHGGTAGGNDTATGGRVAAPIAKQVMEALLTTPPPASQCGSGGTNSGNGG